MARNLSMVPTPVQLTVPLEDIQAVPIHEDQAFDELCSSIMLMNVLQSVVLRAPQTKKGKYDIAAGRRRCAACYKLGIEQIPAIVFPKETDLAFIDIAAITENAVRSSNIGTDILAMKRLVDDGDRDIKSLSRSTGLPEGRIKELFEFIDLPQPLVDGIVAGKVAPSTAKEIKKLKPHALDRALVVLSEKGNLSAKDVRTVREVQIKNAEAQITLPSIPKLPTPDSVMEHVPAGNGETEADHLLSKIRKGIEAILLSDMTDTEMVDRMRAVMGLTPRSDTPDPKNEATMAQRTKRIKKEVGYQ